MGSLKRFSSAVAAGCLGTFLFSGCASHQGSGPVFVRGSASSQQHRGMDEIAWRYSLPEAVAEAQAANKPLMVVFYTKWCGSCDLMDQHTFGNGQVIREAREVIAVKLDAEENEAIAAKYKIREAPTVIFLSPTGRETSRLGAPMPAEGMIQRIEQTLALERQ